MLDNAVKECLYWSVIVKTKILTESFLMNYFKGLQPVRNPARCKAPPSSSSRISLHHYQPEHVEGLVRSLKTAFITKAKTAHAASLCQLDTNEDVTSVWAECVFFTYIALNTE